MKKPIVHPSIPKSGIVFNMARKKGLPVETLVLDEVDLMKVPPLPIKDSPAILVRPKRYGEKPAEPVYTTRDMKELSRTLRLGLGLSQYEWARLLGVEEKSVARIESQRGTVTRQFGNLLRLLSVSRVRDVEVTLDALLSYDESDYAVDARRSFAERIKARAVAVQATFDSTLLDVARNVDLDWYAQKYNRVRSSGAYKGGSK